MRTTDVLKQADSIANLNLPNFLTVVRILLIPVFVVLFSDPTPDRSLAAAIVFVVAAVTDLLDGYLARRHSQITRLGRLLDPIADKLLVLSGLILLVQFDRVAAIVAILIIAREVAVTGVRAISAARGGAAPLEVLVDNPPGADVQVPNFAIAHLAFGQAHVRPRGVDERVRELSQ